MKIFNWIDTAATNDRQVLFTLLAITLTERFRGRYRVRQVRQLTYFSFNRHNDMRL